MDNIFESVTLSWLCCCLLLYCVMFLLTVGVLFYLRSNGQYILDSDAIMAVFLFTIILCEVLINSGRSFLLKVKWTIYFCW